MRVTVSAPEPEILRDAQPGEPFLVHTPELCDCVAALVKRAAPPLGSVMGFPPIDGCIVVIGCRVGPDSASYRPPGYVVAIHLDTPITRLTQVEPAAFRAQIDPAPDGNAADADAFDPLRTLARLAEAYSELLDLPRPLGRNAAAARRGPD